MTRLHDLMKAICIALMVVGMCIMAPIVFLINSLIAAHQVAQNIPERDWVYNLPVNMKVISCQPEGTFGPHGHVNCFMREWKKCDHPENFYLHNFRTNRNIIISEGMSFADLTDYQRWDTSCERE